MKSVNTVIILLYAIHVTSSITSKFKTNLIEPYCSNEAVLQAKLEDGSDNSTESTTFWNTQLLLSLNDTSCFVTRIGPRTTNKHVVKFLRVEHHYGIMGTYEFGVPRIRQACLCDCEDGEDICRLDEYHYKNCTTSPVCYRTLQPYQSNAGCVSSDKLGWFRYEKDNWTVRRGLEKVTKAQHVQVENCKAQRYLSSFDAEQFVLDIGDENKHNFELGNATIEVEPWVKDIRIQDRVIEIVHAEGNALAIFVRTNIRPGVMRHNSQLGDFSGTIQLDSSSNCYMNLTFRDVQGPLQGEVYADDSRNFAELFFHIQAGDQLETIYRSVVSLPASVNSRREVCIHPYGDPQARECRWLEYTSQPLPKPSVRSLWTLDQSECQGCNERGLESFLVNLNPTRWFNGLNSKMEITAFALEMGIMLGVVLVLLLMCLKCIVPLCCCLKWSLKPVTYKASSKKRQLILEKF
ncbi:unnamed protein product [Bursaphelenchus okinawaensis]|uniref:Phlebovirus glycoprotein G2 fusion domain-containing protein n=1 Tax=Bursaphelenchus okinawaensis TaxID=465554 RepID=A0A811LH71_9BILA|nr:unnamed protein product [Bursaphelenchus okinawaensis]CAG9122303.1 unnamed protein product [Bursaphelenchus okinawaensis]